jgi:hypothetical protein
MAGIALICALLNSGADLKSDNQLAPSVLGALRGPGRLELLSLDPSEKRQESTDRFHGWKILGQTTVRDKGGVVKAIEKGVADWDGLVARCFRPRHGIRVQSGSSIVELVICFECGLILTYVNGDWSESVYTLESAQPTLDSVLKKANVRLPGVR